MEGSQLNINFPESDKDEKIIQSNLNNELSNESIIPEDKIIVDDEEKEDPGWEYYRRFDDFKDKKGKDSLSSFKKPEKKKNLNNKKVKKSPKYETMKEYWERDLLR